MHKHLTSINEMKIIPIVARKATSESFKNAIKEKLSVIFKEGRNIVEMRPNGEKIVKHRLNYTHRNLEKKFKLL
ncbi:hypothetical protein DDZ16_19120 [Marinilabilia rubra]|jgi:hypothetical protein|uniref:Uncharacterized protein n=1 Tax=Marinilabilia rubra TaxID=2162893 RepID=A0A2U2B3W0_9BACT|nr:hypothetical protein [Marinilabilia salmonicolor]PWD97748.1 hypothetical protein DDZ16_19120 [Marinilabilia rubra]